MKRKLLMLLAVFAIGSSAWAKTTNAVWGTPAGNGAWDSENNVYTWTLNYSNLCTIFETPDGSLADYTALHLTTSDYTSEYRVCFMNGGTAVATIVLNSAGQKDLVFAERNETKDIDLSTITHISFGGQSGAGSITVTNVYLEGPDPAPGDYTNLSVKDYSTDPSLGWSPDPKDGWSMAVVDNALEVQNSAAMDNWKLQYHGASNILNAEGDDIRVIVDMEADKAGTLYCGAGNWGGNVGKNINFAAGRDTYTIEIKNVPCANAFLLCQSGQFVGTYRIYSITVDKKNVTDAYNRNLAADVTTFAIGKRSGNDWNFATPVDLSAYQYMIVTTIQSAGYQGNGMRITDKNGFIVGEGWGAEKNKGYDANVAGTRGGMWLDRHNNQHCACINIEYVASLGLDIHNVSKFTVPNGNNISAIYLTNYKGGQAVKSTEGWGSCTGDYVRQNALLSEGKFGTIALKYAAAVSGAEVYTVDEWDGNYMTLAKYEGVLEAGVPYIYFACDFVGHDGTEVGGGSNSNVNFYRVDANAVSGDWSDNNARDNGLVGYYDGGFWPGADALKGTYLLAQNELHLIDGGEIALGTNRCFFDPSKYQGPKSGAGTKVRVGVAGAEETAIKDVQNVLNSGKIYDMNGREVKQMEKGGMYIVGGMKVYIKK